MYMEFSDPVRMVMQLAEEEARRLRHEYVGTEHLLLGVVNNDSGVARVILLDLGVDPKRIAHEVEMFVVSGHDLVPVVPEGKLPLTPRARNVVRFAMEEASSLDHDYVGTPHLLLGLLREVEGVGAQILMNLGIRLEAARERTAKRLVDRE
jgi:ATP-dependent Clp protease ATP-binding subunit ClpC